MGARIVGKLRPHVSAGAAPHNKLGVPGGPVGPSEGAKKNRLDTVGLPLCVVSHYGVYAGAGPQIECSIAAVLV